MWRFEFMGRMMREYGYAFAAGPGYFSPFISFMGFLSIIFGIIVIVSAVMLRRQRKQHTTWGILILVFSIFGTFGGMAGYLAGLILGLVGGALAIAWKPSTAPSTTSRNAFLRPSS
jgi:hypothetical protein